MNNVESLPEDCHGDKTHFWGGTRKERLAWHLYQLVIMQGVVCPPKFQVLYVRDACKTSRGCMD